MQPQGARVVTPEAVVLDVQTAGLGSRAFARAIDGLIQGAVLLAVVIITGVVVTSASNSTLGTGGFVVELIVVTVIVFGYPIVWESLWRGRTPGKAALGLRVVTRQGAPIRFRHALVRGLVGLVEVMALPVVGVTSMLASANDQRLGDMAAGTIVIRERAAAHLSVPVVFYPPPGWETFAASLDVSAMTSGEYETVRSFLIRAHEMAPVPRSNLAARLAGPLVIRWHQPVPSSVGPEMWLACVAWAYQRRHGAPTGPAPGPASGPASEGDRWRPAGPMPPVPALHRLPGGGPQVGPRTFTSSPPTPPVSAAPGAVTAGPRTAWAGPSDGRGSRPAAPLPPDASPGPANSGFAPPD